MWPKLLFVYLSIHPSVFVCTVISVFLRILQVLLIGIALPYPKNPKRCFQLGFLVFFFFFVFLFKTYIKPYFFLCYSIVSSFFLSSHTLFSFKNSKLQIIKTFKKKTCGAQTYKFFFSI